jgi:endogenous inhibitor of DNA gyrase (YacG/DUF329 family)
VGGSSTLEVRCPSCGGKAVYGPSNPHRPFCSERCRNIDLGAWASERYRVADPVDPLDEEGPPDAPRRDD